MLFCVAGVNGQGVGVSVRSNSVAGGDFAVMRPSRGTTLQVIPRWCRLRVGGSILKYLAVLKDM